LYIPDHSAAQRTKQHQDFARNHSVHDSNSQEMRIDVVFKVQQMMRRSRGSETNKASTRPINAGTTA
ncbi:MAG: hypothetical protein VKO64_00335, partial [Candidatus Sericytochromatia bacterium]|nr:hypothetical protein [Candidatus Sericytochromatia bacterium]